LYREEKIKTRSIGWLAGIRPMVEVIKPFSGLIIKYKPCISAISPGYLILFDFLFGIFAAR